MLEKKINLERFSDVKELGRKLYEYKANNTHQINIGIFDFPFPDKFYDTIGVTVHGFLFTLKNLPDNLKTILNPSNGLVNIERGGEEVENTLTKDLFYDVKKIKAKIEEYKAIPTKNFINEGYFLYDKSNLIKKTFVTAINKQLNLYGSFSYFSEKTSISNLILINSNNLLKFFIEKNSLKSNLKFQLAQINGSEVKTSDNKIHHFSITKLGKKRKRNMQEPKETIIVRAQQNFDIDGGLNPIEIEIKDDRITNLLKKYKNVVYKITPLGILFPASITNDTTQIFILGKNLSGVKKSILNKKSFNVLAIVDLKKINNWGGIKGQMQHLKIIKKYIIIVIFVFHL